MINNDKWFKVLQVAGTAEIVLGIILFILNL